MNTLINLLVGLPHSRPGGLLLTVVFFLLAGGGAVVLGLIYAAAGSLYPRASLLLQGASALLRGVPLLLLIFACAHLPGLTVIQAGLLALLLYSFSHVGEILRAFAVAYPPLLVDQARTMGIGPLREWMDLRVPWIVQQAMPALLSHWMSLLKDTGALIIIGVGELTTVAKALGESSRDFGQWALVLGMAALLYLGATLLLMGIVSRLASGPVCCVLRRPATANRLLGATTD